MQPLLLLLVLLLTIIIMIIRLVIILILILIIMSMISVILILTVNIVHMQCVYVLSWLVWLRLWASGQVRNATAPEPAARGIEKDFHGQVLDVHRVLLEGFVWLRQCCMKDMWSQVHGHTTEGFPFCSFAVRRLSFCQRFLTGEPACPSISVYSAPYVAVL